MTTPYYNASNSNSVVTSNDYYSASGTTTTTTNSTSQYPRHSLTIVEGKEVRNPNPNLLVPAAGSFTAGDWDSATPIHHTENHLPFEDYNHKQQPKRYQDVLWAILFYVHLAVLIWMAAIYMPEMMYRLAEDYAGGGGDGGGENNGGGDDDDNGSGDDGDEEERRRRYLLRLRFLEGGSNDNNNINNYYDNYMNNNNNNNNLNDLWDNWSYNSSADNNDITLDVGRTLAVVALSGVTAIVLSTMALGFMIMFAETLISVGIISTIILTLLSGFAALLTGQIAGAVMGLMMAGLLSYYACNVWSRIPFAATNLVTATTAVRSNLGVAFYSYLSLCLSFLWALFWTSTTISTLFVLGDCEGDGTCNNDFDGIILFLLLVSYYWTVQVISNVITVTVAGVTGTWWMAPLEAASCCSKAVRDSFVRAMTYSFGSICLGSLIVALISAAKDMVRQLRDSDDSIVVCCAECLLSCIERLVEYFNEWAFAFVGLYGYSFMEAGLEVMTLFRNRGWTNIITDDLAGRALLIMSFFVALSNGILSLVVGAAVGIGDGVPLVIPFVTGFLIGLTLCSTLFSVVGSACKSVIVLYAEAPNEFEANHPELSQRMRYSWRQAWPVDFRY